MPLASQVLVSEACENLANRSVASRSGEREQSLHFARLLLHCFARMVAEPEGKKPRTYARSRFPIPTSCARTSKDCDAYFLHRDRKWSSMSPP
jgi:hypothetical protein